MTASLAATGHGRLVRCIMRSLLRDARRLRQSSLPFLQLQPYPKREAYGHLSEFTPKDYDGQILDALLPPYIREQVTSCQLTGQVGQR